MGKTPLGDCWYRRWLLWKPLTPCIGHGRDYGLRSRAPPFPTPPVVGAAQVLGDQHVAQFLLVDPHLGDGADFAQLVKHYAADHSVEAKHRYSPPHVVRVDRLVVSGRPRHVSTSYVERSNLTLRMQQRRFTRLTNGFSKKLRNHRAAVALYVAHYNLCRVHETIRMTPAMALGITDHIWDIGELIEAANGPEPEGRPVGRFRIIDGGKE